MRVIANISTLSPGGSIVYDPVNHYVYAVDEGSHGGVTVINGIANITLGKNYEPCKATVSANGYVYVVDSCANMVSVISGTKLIANVKVEVDPSSIAYDGYVYVANFGSPEAQEGVQLYLE